MKEELTWEAVYEIACQLNKAFPDEDLETVSLMDIFAWTIALPGFVDDPELANDEILLSIFQEWYEERTSL